MSQEEAIELAGYLAVIESNIPSDMQDLGDLKDVIDFAQSDLFMFGRLGREANYLQQAFEFAKSIPKFSDFESDEFITWLLIDEAHVDYICRTKP